MNSFEGILGNEQIIKNFQNSIKTGKISHSYIISGDEGTGKKLIANSFAKALQCENNTEGTACGKCKSCITFDSGNNTDVFYITPLKTKSIGVDDIRQQIIENVYIKQYRYKYKIFIIDNADSITVQAQNALLKTLEEPPQYAVFLLLAENIDLFLPTILSRCIVFKTEKLSSKVISQKLAQDYNISMSDAAIFAEYSRGSIGQAIKISSSEDFINLKNNTLNLILSLNSKNEAEIINIAKDLEAYKDSSESMLDIFLIWYRDCLAAKSGAKSKIIQKDLLEFIYKYVENKSIDDICSSAKAIINAKRQLLQNSNFLLTMEIMLIKLKEN